MTIGFCTLVLPVFMLLLTVVCRCYELILFADILTAKISELDRIIRIIKIKLIKQKIDPESFVDYYY